MRSLGVDNIGARNEVLTHYPSSGDCVVLLTQFSGKLVTINSMQSILLKDKSTVHCFIAVLDVLSKCSLDVVAMAMKY